MNENIFQEMAERMEKSSDPSDRAFIKFARQGGMALPTKQGAELWKKLLSEETEKDSELIVWVDGKKLSPSLYKRTKEGFELKKPLREIFPDKPEKEEFDIQVSYIWK